MAQAWIVSMEIAAAEDAGLALADVAPAAAFPQGAAPQVRVKRSLDLAIALILIVGLAPALIVIALLVVCDSSGPPLYSDLRRGRDGQPFRMLKFRTMHPDAARRQAELHHLNLADPPLFKLRDDPRVTRVGRFLRRWSLDELPQLANVLRGEMSLVGPRPLVLYEADGLGGAGARRLAMRPGLTGPWQVAGRAELPVTELLRLDTDYVAHWSLRRDIALLLRTVAAVLGSRGAY